MKIATFVDRLDDLIEETNGDASYLELIGALEAAKQRMVFEFMDDADDELEAEDDLEEEDDDLDR